MLRSTLPYRNIRRAATKTTDTLASSPSKNPTPKKQAKGKGKLPPQPSSTQAPKPKKGKVRIVRDSDSEQGGDIAVAPTRTVTKRSRVERKVVDYTKYSNEELCELRWRVNPYEHERNATDPRFWSLVQQDYYESVILKRGVIVQRYIDFIHLRKHKCFEFKLVRSMIS